MARATKPPPEIRRDEYGELGLLACADQRTGPPRTTGFALTVEWRCSCGAMADPEVIAEICTAAA